MVVGEFVRHNGGDIFSEVGLNEVCSAGVVGKELGDVVDLVVECH